MKIQLLGLTFGLALPALLGAAEGETPAGSEKTDGKHVHSDHVEHSDHVMAGYLKVAEALFKDDLVAAKKAAAGVVEHGKGTSLAAAAKTLAKSEDLGNARKAFKALSVAAIDSAKGNASYHVVFCPMVPGGGASWLQSQGEKVNNPYMGAKMPHCGQLKHK